MSKSSIPQTLTVKLDSIIGGGQSIGTLDNGKKALVWGGLPGETVEFRVTKKKSSFVSGVVSSVISLSPERVEPLDPNSYLSTSPWQIMSFEAEQHYKAALIEEAFELHDIVLPEKIIVDSDKRVKNYRNKVEFSWYGDTTDGVETLDLAFFVRSSSGKVPVDSCSLLPDPMIKLAIEIRDMLRKKHIQARSLKTLMIRSNQQGQSVWQLYVKERLHELFSVDEASGLSAQGGEVIYSDPKSPASKITKRLMTFGDTVLEDTILGVNFRYSAESFFQVNIPVYEQALRDMQKWIDKPVVDLYSGVGTIGLTIGGDNVTLVEANEYAVKEMRENIARLGKKATAVLALSEKSLDYITSGVTVIVDPPRAGLHRDVVDALLAAKPDRIIYLSCNPVTQARDIAYLALEYGIRAHRGYNFFPRTPHIEHLVVLDLKISTIRDNT